MSTLGLVLTVIGIVTALCLIVAVGLLYAIDHMSKGMGPQG